MLKRYANYVLGLKILSDFTFNGVAWMLAYWLRFSSGWFPVSRGVEPFSRHIKFVVPVTIIFAIANCLTQAYKSKRTQNYWGLFKGILTTTFITVLLISGVLYYIQARTYSRVLIIVYGGFLLMGLTISHVLVGAVLRQLRLRRYNLRYFAVIGSGIGARSLIAGIHARPEFGMVCSAIIDNHPAHEAKDMGIPVYEPIDQLAEILQEHPVDEVYLATSGSDVQQVYPILRKLQTRGLAIRILPNWGSLSRTGGITVTCVGEQILFSAEDSRLTGLNILCKGLFDRVVALGLLILLTVPMVAIAILIKCTSRGPVFYRQKRVGLANQSFTMLKFRSMRINAEQIAQWTSKNDPRRTVLGAFLRRTCLDELPQLCNVLIGQMSLVGPRPEQSGFVELFSKEYREYMLRHKVKPGITGWAQIHDCRGDTSLKRRLVYDLYYVRNWSFLLDCLILLRTPGHILRGKNGQ